MNLRTRKTKPSKKPLKTLSYPKLLSCSQGLLLHEFWLAGSGADAPSASRVYFGTIPPLGRRRIKSTYARMSIGKPSICAINGFALGGGCELALSCSIRIASKTARLGQPEVKLGILPGYGGSQRLTRLCGKGLAHELCLTGEMISAEEALRIGLVNHIYEPAELLTAAEAMAKKIIANAPLAVKFTMEAIERGVEMPLEEGLFLEATLFGVACATDDMREGTKAFLEKRPAAFKGK